ncbi:MAG: hypothetical protein WAM04_14225 [Candidatus Sulfotelmatobacter sp.]
MTRRYSKRNGPGSRPETLKNVENQANIFYSRYGRFFPPNILSAAPFFGLQGTYFTKAKPLILWVRNAD